jgi:hypothetical protein
MAPARSVATRETIEAFGSVTIAGHRHDHA